jgi:hypothetical protein
VQAFEDSLAADDPEHVETAQRVNRHHAALRQGLLLIIQLAHEYSVTKSLVIRQPAMDKLANFMVHSNKVRLAAQEESCLSLDCERF